MKKILITLLLVAAMMALAACGGGNGTQNGNNGAGDQEFDRESKVTVTDLRGDTIANVPVNPTTVALYCFGVLDTLYRAGWENTGIELVIVPSKDTLPDELAWFRNQPNSTVVNGGTLHWVDWGVLDMAQPQLVITGQRSFAMDHNEQRLDPDDMAALREETQERYDGTVFIHLGQNMDFDQVENVERISSVLAQIFPATAEYLTTTFASFDAQVTELRTAIEAKNSTAMVVTLHTPFEFSVDIGVGRGRSGVVFDIFGFENPAAAEADTAMFGQGDADAELVLRINPDVIFVLPHSALGDPSAAINNFKNDSIIQTTDAFANGNIFKLQTTPWHTLTTGFTGMEAMIEDVRQFVESQ